MKPAIPLRVEEFMTSATFDELRAALATALRQNHNSGKLWDLITASRGPDWPSEPVNDYGGQKFGPLYDARRKRKYDSTEVIRQLAFFGVVGGSARSHSGTSVTVQHPSKQDHFDRHVVRAAHVLGLTVKEHPKEFSYVS